MTANWVATIQGRREDTADVSDSRGDGIDFIVKEGDVYSTAALSVVLPTRKPYVPTFRSDVSIFLVKSSSSDEGRLTAWFGGGSDLTPYYLIDEDVVGFHSHLKRMCNEHSPPGRQLGRKRLAVVPCDEAGVRRLLLPPHGGGALRHGGAFFNDLPATSSLLAFVRDVARGWTPSWLLIAAQRGRMDYTEEEKNWQMLWRYRSWRSTCCTIRGSSLDANTGGVIVSVSPGIAFDYNHIPEEGSEDEWLVEVLKNPKDWS
ncbi:LOW QUALITY PROTEIN: hypothetical protein ACHAWF_003184 [Thalassiosira exigua]